MARIDCADWWLDYFEAEEVKYMRAGMPIEPDTSRPDYHEYQDMWLEALRQCHYEPTDGWYRLMEQQHMDMYNPGQRMARWATRDWLWRRCAEYDIRQYFQGNGSDILLNNTDAADTVRNMIAAYEHGVPMEDIIA